MAPGAVTCRVSLWASLQAGGEERRGNWGGHIWFILAAEAAEPRKLQTTDGTRCARGQRKYASLQFYKNTGPAR